MSIGMRIGGRRGFTLVELIIVAAILAALAAVAVPPYMSYRNSAREAAALENARLVAGAVNVHNATTAPPITQDALRDADTAAELEALLGGYAPLFSRDADAADAVSRVSITGGFAAAISP